MAGSSCVGQPNWLDLPLEILELILEKIVSIRDIKSMKAVCGCWRKAANSYMISFPLLVLPKDVEGSSTDTKSQISFYSIEEQRNKYNLKTCMSDFYTRFWMVVGSSCGWLVIYERKHFLRHDLSLFNPLSRVKFLLPSVENLLLPSNCIPDDDMLYATKAILLSDPRRVVAVSSAWPTTLAIYIIKNGNSTSRCRSEWIEFGYRLCYEDILWHNDKLYALIYGGTVDVWEFRNDSLKVPTKVASLTKPDHHHDIQNRNICHLVGSLGVVLFVIQATVDMPVPDDHDHKHTLHFHVYKLDNYSGKKWEKLENLGDRILFLTTDRTSMSVCARNWSKFQKNSIYFVSWIPAGSLLRPWMRCAGVYNYEEKVARSFNDSVSFQLGRATTWILPNIDTSPNITAQSVFRYRLWEVQKSARVQ